jgi:hypothetical protein
MAVKIDKKIVSWSVDKSETKSPEASPEATAPMSIATVVEMHEKIKRPEHLHGKTYKVKSPNVQNALYISINDIILNEGTEHERRQPFEIFINSRDMQNFQWVSALTLVLSAIFRKGGDVTFIVDELEQVFDPAGGYFKGGRFVPSLVAEIGIVIKRHMKSIGMITDSQVDPGQAAFLEEKRAKHTEQDSVDGGNVPLNYPASASLCKKCHVKAIVVDGGCATCLNCGDSKCS